MNTCFLMFSFFYFIMHSHCELSSNSVERIIGGFNENIASAPYQLQIILNGQYICSASIITNRLAITAAHCIIAARDPLEELIIKSGCTYLSEICSEHNIINFYIPEEYNNIINDYDIGIIEVSPMFTYNHVTKPVDLPSNKNVYTKWAKVCGWGYYLKNNYYDNIAPVLATSLRCIVIPKISQKQCYQDYKYNYVLTPRMICYGFQNGIKDTCQGDSGAGLVNKDKVLLGITSWGIGCGEMNFPGVYTNVSYFVPWIYNIMERTEKKYTYYHENICVHCKIIQILKYMYKIVLNIYSIFMY